MTNYCKKLHESCALFYDDSTPYIFYISIFDDPVPPTLEHDFTFVDTSSSNLSHLKQKLLMNSADSVNKEKQGVDKENAIVIYKPQNKKSFHFQENG